MQAGPLHWNFSIEVGRILPRFRAVLFLCEQVLKKNLLEPLYSGKARLVLSHVNLCTCTEIFIF